MFAAIGENCGSFCPGPPPVLINICILSRISSCSGSGATFTLNLLSWEQNQDAENARRTTFIPSIMNTTYRHFGLPSLSIRLGIPFFINGAGQIPFWYIWALMATIG
jgi:hypothetical protein